MLLYVYRCAECGAEREEYNRANDCETMAPFCHGQMRIKICAPQVVMREDCHYICTQTGQEVTSQRQRRNIMAEHNLVDARGLEYPRRIAEMKARKAEQLELAKQNDIGIDLTPYIPEAP